MDIELDSAAILYALGAVTGIAAVVFFGAEVAVALSPTVKAALLLAGFVAFLVAGLSLPVDLPAAVAYVLAAAAYLVSVGYTVSRFRPGSRVTFLLLAASSVLFVGLGYLVRERGLDLTRREAGAVVAVVLVAGAGLVALDAAGPDPAYRLELRDSANVTSGESVRVGTLVADNRFALSRTMDVPEYYACVYTPDRRAPTRVDVDRYASDRPPDLLRGGETRRMAARIHVPYELSGERPEDGPPPRVTLGVVPIGTSTACPPASDVLEPRVVVVRGEVREAFR